eukprot:CAMPEP_0114537608 /NCGR_PEP_ID=MMETSP0109-20121206/29672_1 /TAXON_ID=29199 /ORGANISM="Chlorarachnion reptans, Strain CCCM449" /LENGTH=165 /DNA_ID=CAMNT_0001721515 /DNA_START=132 /DNA_END=629 /DNA_ORIENTATION=-
MEANSFGSMLSRSKYMKELESLKEEYEAKKRCKTVLSVDQSSVNIKDLMEKKRTSFKPPTAINVNVNVNTDGHAAYPKRTLEGYRVVDREVPFGKPVYCLGKVTLDKSNNKMVLSRDTSKPFIFQYGSEEDALANAEFYELRFCLHRDRNHRLQLCAELPASKGR